MMFGSIKRHGQKAMIRTIHKLLNDADAVVHFNGKKFDIPTLNREFLLAGLTPPAPFKQIDLLQTCRRKFKFASNRLDYVSQALGEGAKVEHKGMDLWKGCMAGNPEDWKVMEEYNKHDVRLTERMYDRLRAWIDGHPNMGQYVEDGEPCCPNCGSHKLQARGVSRTAAFAYRRWQCNSCGKWSRSRSPDKSYGRPELVAA